VGACACACDVQQLGWIVPNAGTFTLPNAVWLCSQRLLNALLPCMVACSACLWGYWAHQQHVCRRVGWYLSCRTYIYSAGAALAAPQWGPELYSCHVSAGTSTSCQCMWVPFALLPSPFALCGTASYRGLVLALHVCPGHGVKLLGRLPCVQKVQASIPARRMVPFFGAMALSLSVLLSGLCPCGASVRGRGFGHFASTKCHPV
jgi:hypothetical protein